MNPLVSIIILNWNGWQDTTTHRTSPSRKSGNTARGK